MEGCFVGDYLLAALLTQSRVREAGLRGVGILADMNMGAEIEGHTLASRVPGD